MNFLRQSVHALCQAVKQLLRRWTKPINDALLLNAAVDLTRSKTELMLENALLRQQLIVLQRQEKRPVLTWRDRALFVLLTSKLRTWKQAPLIGVLRTHCSPIPSCAGIASCSVESGDASQGQRESLADHPCPATLSR